MGSVTAKGPGLVAVGRDDDAGDAAVWTSVDGITWSRVPHHEAIFGGGGRQGMLSVIAAGPSLVAVGRDDDDNDFDAGAVWVAATEN